VWVCGGGGGGGGVLKSRACGWQWWVVCGGCEVVGGHEGKRVMDY